MAAPTFELSEKNTAGATLTANVPGISYASTDSASTSGSSATNPILNNSFSYEKFNYIEVLTTASNTLSGFSFFFSPTAVLDHGGSSTNVTIKYDAAATPTFGTPVATSSALATTNITTNTTTPGQTVTAPANSTSALSAAIVTQLNFATGVEGGNATFPGAYLNVPYSYS